MRTRVYRIEQIKEELRFYNNNYKKVGVIMKKIYNRRIEALQNELEALEVKEKRI